MAIRDDDADGPEERTVADTGDAPARTRLIDDGRTEIVDPGPASDGVHSGGHSGGDSAGHPGERPGEDATAIATRIDDLSLAETRLFDEDDKTSPPPVGSAERGPAAAGAPAAPAPPRRVAAAPSARDADRGLQPGTVLFGEYEIVNVLGVGGMGEVYRARHRRLDEHRAIKVMHAELSQRRGASEFFYREAKALLAVRHPAVVHCHDLLSDEAGRVYLIMEMIEGVPLSRKLSEGPLSPDEVAILGARVAHGLAAAHRKGVIHRDLSPDNIVLPGGRVQDAKIIDFGIAKLLEQGEGTIVDGFKGKLSYASPEQLGFFGGKLDGRSDLYSLGLVLVAAALGRPMPMGTSVMEAVDARRSLQGLPDAVPVGLRSAIQPLLALDPKDRPQYVDRLFVVPGAFEGAGDGSGVLPGSAGEALAAHAERGAPRGAQASRAPLYTGLAAGAAFLVAAAVFVVPQWSGMLAIEGDGPAAAAAANAPLVGETNGGSSGAVAPTGSAPAAGSGESAGSAGLASVPSAPSNAGEPAPAQAAAPAPAPRAVAVAKPAAPTPRGPSAADRLKIVGMLQNAKLALGENRLMSPAGDNAYDRYRSVLRLEPGNAAAKSGLREIAARYVALANAAVDEGDTATAREHLRRARQADASHAGIRAAEQRIVAP
ncbi:MAG: serine/threonine-protein kinase [Myxococcota bacterium]